MLLIAVKYEKWKHINNTDNNTIPYYGQCLGLQWACNCTDQKFGADSGLRDKGGNGRSTPYHG